MRRPVASFGHLAAAGHVFGGTTSAWEVSPLRICAKSLTSTLPQVGDRTVNLMPLWDGTHWRMWFPTPGGLIEGKVVDATEADYVAHAAAKPSDLFIPFVHIMWQRASWREICPLINAICDDFHNMGTSVAKLRHFFGCRRTLAPGSVNRFASTEMEYLAILTRTVFDLLQEMISIIWREKVQLLDESAEAHRRGHSLPETFSKFVLKDKQSFKSADDIERDYRLPRALAERYAELGPFFAQLRDLRDRVVHGGKRLRHDFRHRAGILRQPEDAALLFVRGLASRAPLQRKYKFGPTLDCGHDLANHRCVQRSDDHLRLDHQTASRHRARISRFCPGTAQ